MHDSLPFLISGVVLGFTAGVSPGPLLTLVISETLKHSVKEGVKVAMAPLLTDLPIILVTFLLLSRVSNFKPVLGVISLTGAVFLAYIAYETITAGGEAKEEKDITPQSLRKGMITNFLNPNPYLFWFSVGSPTMLKAAQTGAIPASLFILGFYVFIVGSKVALALGVERSRSFLRSRAYIYTQKFLGLSLLIFAVFFIRDALKYFGFIS